MDKLIYCITNDLWQLWERKSPIPINEKGMSLDLIGYSQGSQSTNFMIKNGSIAFDAGISCPYDCDHVGLTHGHSDHSAGLYFYPLHHSKTITKTIEVLDNSPIPKKVKLLVKENHIQNIYVPVEIAHLADELIQAHYNISKGFKMKRSDTCYNIVAVKPGDSIPIKFMNRDATLDVFRCFHGKCPCVGYGITVKITEVLPEYKNLKPEEKKELGIKGVKMTGLVDYPYFFYCGDTDKNILKTTEEQEELILSEDFPKIEKNEEDEHSWRIKKSFELEGYKTHERKLNDYKVIMIECNFLYDEHYEEATKRHHMHYRDIKEYALQNPNCTFILNHFSMRYTYLDIERFFKDPINGKPENVHYWNSANRKIAVNRDDSH